MDRASAMRSWRNISLSSFFVAFQDATNSSTLDKSTTVLYSERDTSQQKGLGMLGRYSRIGVERSGLGSSTITLCHGAVLCEEIGQFLDKRRTLKKDGAQFSHAREAIADIKLPNNLFGHNILC